MEFSWLITLILAVIILYAMYYLANMNTYYWEKRGLPYSKTNPIIGIMKDVVLNKRGLGEILCDIYNQFEGEKYCGFFQFFTPAVLIRDPELINQILIKDFSYFEDRGYSMKGSNDLFSLSLSSLTGNEWRNARHKLTPTFTSGKLKMMFGSIKECSDEVVCYIEKKLGQDIETRDIMLRYILNVIGNVAFGLKLDTINESDEQSVAFFKISSNFFQPSFLFLMKFLISLNIPKIRRIFNLRLIDDEVEVFFRGLTHDVIKYRERTNERRNDFLQLMLDIAKKEKENSGKDVKYTSSYSDNLQIESEDKELMEQLKNTPLVESESLKSEIFTEEFISSQTFLFISGGSETTATVLSFIFYELAVNQDLQKKLQDEVERVLSSQQLNYQALKKMTYMDQFINETFRLHPINANLLRMCTRDYKIPGTDIILEKGTSISIPIIALHNDPQYFPDPKKFDPDRFENMDAIPKGVYFNFGAGPRICIAMRLAILEMKVILSAVLLKYTVILSDKTLVPLKSVRNSIMLRPEGGVWVKFQKREN